MTEPRTASDLSDADRAEEALLEPQAPLTAGEAAPVGDGVDEADALDQQLTAGPGEWSSARRSVGDREANDVDVLEQEEVVPIDDDDVPT